jgi:alpha-L-rhamnosidase
MATTLIGVGCGCTSGTLHVQQLRCEHRLNPNGVDVAQPRFGWIVTSDQRNARQLAYQIVAGTDHANTLQGIGDLWDSGKVDSAETIDIAYRGRPLTSHQQVYWSVRSWDQDGKVSGWSAPASFIVGIRDRREWKAKWIGLDAPRAEKVEPAPLEGAKWIMFSGDEVNNAPPGERVFITQFESPRGAMIQSATAIASGDDRLHFTINTALTAYRTQPQSWQTARVMDLKDHVHVGVNRLRVGVTNAAQGPTGFIAKITITLQDGKKIELLTDDTWRASFNPGDYWHSREIAPDAWPKAKVVGEYGVAPWGKITTSDVHLPPPILLRKGFELSKPVKRALIYTTALGNSDLYLNGDRVSDEYFTPGWTDYSKRVYYRAFDVTQKLKSGDNAIGVVLADGWFGGYVGFGHQRDHYGKKTRAMVQLRLEYADGNVDTIVTDESWKASTGPTLYADFLMGEKYDARKEIPNWCAPGFDDSTWAKVDVGTDEITPRIQWHPAPPVTAFEEFRPVKITQIEKGVHVLDLGQNFAGVVKLRIEGAKPGQEITLRHAERLNPDGTIYTTNLRAARATDTYICKGEAIEEWSPRFTFHGFQFVEVTGLDTIKPDTIVGLALSSDTPIVGTFECSDPMLNRLHRNIYYTQRMNFIDIPTDCPQRDERLGWTADAQVYMSAATLNCDVQAFFDKWLVDLIDSQRGDGQFPMVAPLKVAGDDGGPAWADAGTIAPWTIYQVYGDKNLLERQYPSMKKFVEFCKNRSPNLLPPEKFHCFGDWLSINADTPKDVIYEAFFAESTRITALAAEVLGRTEDAKELWKLWSEVKAAFNKAYVSPDGRIKGDTQTCYVLALDFDLVDGANRDAAAKYLVEDIEKKNWHLSTGFVGTKTLMNVLSRIGRAGVAYRLIHNETFPSWGFSVKHGATSIWERWDGWTPDKGFQDPGMNSFAHYSFGAVYQWMVENIGGIQPGDVSYRKIIIAPQFDQKLSHAKVTYNSVRGLIGSQWKREGAKINLQVTIPTNTTATIVLPQGVDSSALHKIDVGSGRHHFVVDGK